MGRGLYGVGLGLGVGLFACRVTPVDRPTGQGVGVDAALSAEVHAVMDEAADPCTDFYRYACGQWIDETEIPGHESRFGRFHALAEANNDTMRQVLDDLSRGSAATGERAQLGRFYARCMDQPAAEAAGLGALQPLLRKIDQARAPAAAMAVIAELHRYRATVLFDVDVEPDYDEPKLNIAHLSQGGLGLPDRDYYLKDEPGARALREAYVEHVALVLEALGEPRPAAAAADVVAFETALAEAATPRDQLRDPEKRRNKVPPTALDTLAPGLPWSAYFEAAGRPELAVLNVSPPSFFARLAKVWGGSSWEIRRAYLKWHIGHALAEHLPSAIADAHFTFFKKQLRGQKLPTPRWRLCVQATDRALGEALGREFVERRFSGDSKRIAQEMIAQVEQAFEVGLAQLAWMDDATRQRAVEKMKAIVNKVGYPEAWRDYSALAVGDDHLANVMAGRRFEWQRRAEEIGKAVDAKEWHMTPPTVNAYYNPSGNEMVFPAGILQPPFFSAAFPMAMNFGGIGMVMGHELTHGFDDQGRKYDGDGRLTEWWGEDAVERFEQRAACVEELYSDYEVQPGVNLNGTLTLGENIADFGGIKQTHGAYQAWAAAHGGDAEPHVEGLTNEQLMFVAFGQIWCTNATPEIERVLALTDPHAHPRYRVNGPLSHFPAFWEAFSCEPGAAMRADEVCEVW